jgi:hypothetical protein
MGDPTISIGTNQSGLGAKALDVEAAHHHLLMTQMVRRQSVIRGGLMWIELDACGGGV